MINLLFISNSPRAELLRGHFQQMLKIRIDVVEDFDHGLKDVFEKRPVAVCIQDQIAGVTGESVARHIQLLLGNAAPGFILMHEGNAKAKLVPGLFGHLVDLEAPFETVCEVLRAALQSLFGDRWDMLYSAPAESVPLASEAGPVPTATLADQLVDEFIAENNHVVESPSPLPPRTKEPAVVGSFANTTFDHDLPGGPPAEPHAAKVMPPVPLAEPEALEAPVPRDPLMAGKQPPAFLQQQPALDRPVRPVQQAPAVASDSKNELSAAEEESVAVDELLQAFEEKYHGRKRLLRWVGITLITLLLLGAFLYWLYQRDAATKHPAVVKQNLPVRSVQQAPVQPVVSSVRSAVPPPVVHVAENPPKFVGQAKRDSSFSDKKPGWSRYLSARRDYRLFHANGRLRALQVIAATDSTIAPSELKQVLRELTGKDQYLSGHQEHKAGVWQERATVPGYAELLIYRSTSNGPIKAFVYAPTP